MPRIPIMAVWMLPTNNIVTNRLAQPTTSVAKKSARVKKTMEIAKVERDDNGALCPSVAAMPKQICGSWWMAASLNEKT